MRVRIFNRTDLGQALKDFLIDNEDISLLNFLENGLNSEVSKRFKRYTAKQFKGLRYVC